MKFLYIQDELHLGETEVRILECKDRFDVRVHVKTLPIWIKPQIHSDGSVIGIQDDEIVLVVGLPWTSRSGMTFVKDVFIDTYRVGGELPNGVILKGDGRGFFVRKVRILPESIRDGYGHCTFFLFRLIVRNRKATYVLVGDWAENPVEVEKWPCTPCLIQEVQKVAKWQQGNLSVALLSDLPEPARRRFERLTGEGTREMFNHTINLPGDQVPAVMGRLATVAYAREVNITSPDHESLTIDGQGQSLVLAHPWPIKEGD